MECFKARFWLTLTWWYAFSYKVFQMSNMIFSAHILRFCRCQNSFPETSRCKKVPISSAHHSRNMNLEFASIFLTSREVSLFEFFSHFWAGCTKFQWKQLNFGHYSIQYVEGRKNVNNLGSMPVWSWLFLTLFPKDDWHFILVWFDLGT